MIFNFHKLSRITKLSLIIFIICGDFYSRFYEDLPIFAQAVAQNLKPTKNQSFSKQIDHFLNNRIKASKDECVKIFGRYTEIIASELILDKLYFVSYKEVENLLDQAVSESIDSLTLFTSPLLQDPQGFAIVFNEGLLQQIKHKLLNPIPIEKLYDG